MSDDDDQDADLIPQCCGHYADCWCMGGDDE